MDNESVCEKYHMCRTEPESKKVNGEHRRHLTIACLLQLANS